MQQRAPTALDAMAELPACRKLEHARVKLEEARLALAAAETEFRSHTRRITGRGSILLDAQAREAESQALKAHAAMRLAASEVESVRQAHGAVLARHFAKHEAASIETLTLALGDVLDIARRIARAVEAAERDGASPTLKMGKVRGVEVAVRNLLEKFK